jgi:hypothetical protein
MCRAAGCDTKSLVMYYAMHKLSPSRLETEMVFDKQK